MALHARTVVRELSRAVEALEAAEAATSDASVSIGVEAAGKLARAALKRARAVAKDVGLRYAEQPGLEL